MNMRAFCVLLVILIFSLDHLILRHSDRQGECTIGVFSGRVTSDGRPLLWKNRDITNAVEKYCYFARTNGLGDTTYAYIANCNSNDTTRVYMGLNEMGFAIMNSNSYNMGDSLNDGIDDGRIMRLALEHCRSLADFEHILDMTNLIGRRDGWNFGAIDAEGNGAIYECGNRHYTAYYADDSLGESDGYVLRATFGFSGQGDYNGFPRYKRATDLVKNRLRVGPIDAKFITQILARDLANSLADPYPLPYDGVQNGRPAGCILVHEVTINRDVSRACMVVRGIIPGDDPSLATMYGMMGQPVLSVAFPMWVKSSCVPWALNDSINVPMYREYLRRYSRLYSIPGEGTYLNSRYLVGKNGTGFLTYSLPLESSMYDTVENHLTLWRQNLPDSAAFASLEIEEGDRIYNAIEQIPLDFSHDQNGGTPPVIALGNYPNPFNANTTIQLTGFNLDEPIDIRIFNLLGQEVKGIQLPHGNGNQVVWNGTDNDNRPLSSGVYLVQAMSIDRVAATKAILLK
jgi:hypothetical protein